MFNFHPDRRIRERSPLVHCITNSVTIQWMANGLLAAGARPIMVLDKAESADMARHSDALLLNYGTWGPEQQESMLHATAAANEAGVPVILDPVGAGALIKRTEAALDILESRRIDIIRGNGGEIVGLVGTAGLTRGVDSDVDPGRNVHVEAAARQLARRHDALVIATGRHDLVTDGEQTWVVRGGHPMLQDVVGSGCLVGALVAAAAAAAADRRGGNGPAPEHGDGAAANRPDGERRFDTAAAAETLLWCKYVGEQAAADVRGPGSLAVRFLDELGKEVTLPRERIAPPLAERLATYVIVDGAAPTQLVEDIVRAGVGTIQFRDKAMDLAGQVEAARRVRDVCRAHGALFIVNDHVDVAKAVDADGVHVGQADMAVDTVRALMSPDKIVGVSVASAAEAEAAARAGADYLGTGPVYETPTKPGVPPLGVELLQQVRDVTGLPQVAIAGMRPDRVPAVMEAGADGVAVITAVVEADDPGAAAAKLVEAVQQAKAERQAR